MLTLSSTHRAMLALKDAQISNLQEQVAFLREMVQPNARIQLVSHQANSILDSHHDMSMTLSPEQEKIDQEARDLLSGNY